MRYLTLVSACLALAASQVALAAPKSTRVEIDKARGECKMHKDRVAKMEAAGSQDPGRLAEERRTWELSCVHAQSLMEAAGMDKPSAPVRPAQPAAEISVMETRPAPRKPSPALPPELQLPPPPGTSSGFQSAEEPEEPAVEEPAIEEPVPQP